MTWPELLDAVRRYESGYAERPPGHGAGSHAAADPAIRLSLVTDDSRKVQPGAVFVAIKGANHDGLEFIPAACAAGAAVIVAERRIDPPPGVVLYTTPNASAWLARAAAAWHGLDRIQRRGELAVVGVTGTNGKTTTTYLVQSMLASAGRPCAVIGTVTYDLIGRRIAAPLTTPPAADLAAMLVEAHGHGARAAAMEVSSHSLEQHRVDGIRFGVGVFTNLTGDHLDYHGTMEAYAAAKKRLFDLLPRDGAAVINADDPQADYMVTDCAARIIRFGFSPGAALTADILSMSTDGTRIAIRRDGRAVETRTPLFGRHNVMNLLGAVGAGLALGLDLEVAAAGAARLSRVRG
ncbi:MAG: UDP-N-acetylmuramoyl-L-alanyl-D-glutamate--2,6-diaminopimelate ligase, partial [Phycisphaerae bacterium]|nr:UDP-N-acetylmuramoyl-L-alanyl-D-glutamate--2,6-diaminopimelate ligase [Phycisphaerae bacterium]